MTMQDYLEAVSATQTMNATGDKFTLTPSVPIDIIRWGVIVDNTLIDVGAGMTIKMDHRPTAGSDTDRTDGTPSTAEDLVTTVDILAGKGAYVELDEPFEVDPGEEVVFQVTDAADTAGNGFIFVHYRPRPFVGDSGVTAGDPGNRIDNMLSV